MFNHISKNQKETTTLAEVENVKCSDCVLEKIRKECSVYDGVMESGE